MNVSIFSVRVLLIVGLATSCSSASLNAASELAAPMCNYGTAHADAPKEFSQFQFLIGDFSIEAQAWTGEAWTPPRPDEYPPRWNGRYGLGGMAIYDEWYNLDPAQNPQTQRGVNVRMYDPEAQQWKMMWIASGTLQTQDLRAEMRDGKLTMWQVYPERPNFMAEFEEIDDDHWFRVSYTKDENGAWVPQFKLTASRISCE